MHKKGNWVPIAGLVPGTAVNLNDLVQSPTSSAMACGSVSKLSIRRLWDASVTLTNHK
jgi:hypothetical protein